MALSALALASSLYGAKSASSWRAEAEARAAQAAEGLRAARALAEDASGLRPGLARPQPLALALAATSSAISTLAGASGVRIVETGIEGAGSAFDAVDLDQAARPLPVAPRIRRVSLSVKGSYSRLDGLRAWLGRVASGQAAIAALKVDGERFEAVIHVFGL